ASPVPGRLSAQRGPQSCPHTAAGASGLRGCRAGGWPLSSCSLVPFTEPHLSTLPAPLTQSSPTTQPDLFTERQPWVISTVTDIALIAGVVTAVAFVLLCLLFLTLHYMYRHKGTYHTNEAKGTEFAESADAALQDDPSLQDAGGSRKEYFI
ncbi:hypothetical protein MC885_020507, partial [Smutsia gigantea]